MVSPFTPIAATPSILASCATENLIRHAIPHRPRHYRSSDVEAATARTRRCPAPRAVAGSLPPSPRRKSPAAACRHLGNSQSAVKVICHRLRRCAPMVRDQIRIAQQRRSRFIAQFQIGDHQTAADSRKISQPRECSLSIHGPGAVSLHGRSRPSERNARTPARRGRVRAAAVHGWYRVEVDHRANRCERDDFAIAVITCGWSSYDDDVFRTSRWLDDGLCRRRFADEYRPVRP